MLNSFAMMRAGLTGAQSRPNSPRAASFLEKRGLIRGNFQHFLWAPEPVEAISVCYRGTAREDKMQISIRFSQNLMPGSSMHITAAHISPIISLIAGLLILIMPRLLNLIVAIFLIVNGLLGLGLLRWLHL
jgi:hypothetical protein